MKKTIIILITLIMTNTAGCAQSNKESIIGKTYQAEVEHITGKMLGGGFNEITYCYLRFETDSVEITHRKIRETSIYGEVNNSEKYETKTCKWKLQNEEIIIENFNDYGQLIFRADQIFGKDRFGNELIFSRKEEKIMLKTGIV